MDLESLSQASPVLLAFLAGLYTWFMTSLGAGIVFLQNKPSQKTQDVMLGFAGGVMIAVCFWSLLTPAIKMSEGMSVPVWFPAAVGFMGGGIFLRIVDRTLPHLHRGLGMEKAEGIKTTLGKSTLLVLAITLHNIPEGIAIGVAFGGIAAGLPEASLAAAVTLTIGIGIQNFPEGATVSLPLRREGNSKRDSFFYGQLSGMVEPLSAIAGALFVVAMSAALPYALAFAAGAMIFVVAEEVIPEMQVNGYGDQATMGLMTGFTTMMILDVAFV